MLGIVVDLPTFGALFGEFILQKRLELKLSQENLAEKAWPRGPGKARHPRVGDISRLEKGRIADPENTTVRAILGALGEPLSTADRLRREAREARSSAPKQTDETVERLRAELADKGQEKSFMYEYAYLAQSMARYDIPLAKVNELVHFIGSSDLEIEELIEIARAVGSSE